MDLNGYSNYLNLKKTSQKIIMKIVIRDIQMLDIQKMCLSLHTDLPFLLETSKIKKCNKLVCSVCDKKNYIVHIKVLKQAVNRGVILEKMRIVIQFNQEAWLKH